MGTQQGRIVIFAQDTGQTRVLVPVLQWLGNAPDEFDLQIIAHRQAVPVLSESEVRFRDAATLFNIPLTVEQARTYLQTARPDLVIAGAIHPHTVTGDLSALNLLRAAKETGRRTLVILDHWQGLDRFAEGDTGKDVYAPAYLGVMDEWTREQLLPTLKRTCIDVVGHPYLERVWQQARSHDWAARRARCRERYGVLPEETVWVVVSQPLVSLKDPRERTSLLDLQVGAQGLIQSVQKLAKAHAGKCGQNVRVVLRPHPQELPHPHLLTDSERRLAEASAADTLLLADLLIGWDSMMLIEGFFAGVPVLSLRFLSEHHTGVDLERMGIGGHCKTWEDVRQWVQGRGGAPLQSQVGDQHLGIVAGATDRAVQFIHRVLAN